MKFDKFYHEEWGILLTGLLTLIGAGVAIYFLLPTALGTPDNPTIAILCDAVLLFGFFVYLIYTIGQTDNGFVCFLTVLFTVIIDLGGAVGCLIYQSALSRIDPSVSQWVWIIPHAIILSTALNSIIYNIEGDADIGGTFGAIIFRYTPLLSFAVCYFALYGLSFTHASIAFFSEWMPLILCVILLVINIVVWAKLEICIDNDLPICPTIAESIKYGKDAAAKKKEAEENWEATPEPECFKGLSENEKLALYNKMKDDCVHYTVTPPEGGLSCDKFLDAFCSLMVKEHGFADATHGYPLYQKEDGKYFAKVDVSLKVNGAFPVTWTNAPTSKSLIEAEDKARAMWNKMSTSEKYEWDNDFYTFLRKGSGEWRPALRVYRAEYRKALKLTSEKSHDIFDKFYSWISREYGVYGMDKVLLGAYKPPRSFKKKGVYKYVPVKLAYVVAVFTVEEAE